ncbi:MAG: 1-acyl-sn-glycerol-3-phosphate acyltransferase [Oscillospiraceae bacterium]|nr:1-acyl-sn-glycerol-3-phosphate acyltransferase [Oscillospiraceae bacterium]
MIAQKKKKAKKWIQLQHKVVMPILRELFRPIALWMYHLKVERFKEENGRQYLVLANHQTGFDQFYPSFAFKQHLYYVASEDIFSMGWLSKLIVWIAAPIPIKKQVTDIRAVMNCLKVAKEGGSIAMFPEGNRTFSGATGAINPAVGGLAKKLGLPIAFFKIEGGYGVQPRWSDVRRKGKMKAYVSHVLEPEEYKDWTNDQMYQYICKKLYQNEANSDTAYYHKKSAEYLERVLYVCPHCGITHFESNGDTVRCTSCGRSAKYLPTKEFSGDFQFPYMLDWYTYQEDYINKLDTLALTETPIIRDTCSLYQVALYSKKQLLAENVELSLYGDRIEMSGSFKEVFPFDKVENITILGKNKLDIYHAGVVYQIQSDKRFNALKYLNLYHRYKNLTSEVQNGSFLGL